MAGRVWMRRDDNDDCGIGSREMFDDRIVASSGFTTHIPLSTGVLSVTSTMLPPKCTVYPESTQPR